MTVQIQQCMRVYAGCDRYRDPVQHGNVFRINDRWKYPVLPAICFFFFRPGMVDVPMPLCRGLFQDYGDLRRSSFVWEVFTVWSMLGSSKGLFSGYDRLAVIWECLYRIIVFMIDRGNRGRLSNKRTNDQTNKQTNKQTNDQTNKQTNKNKTKQNRQP